MGIKDDPNATTENRYYGTGWETCSVCKITAVDVVDHRCVDQTRCRKVILGLSLGSPLVLEAPVRFDLDADEQASVAVAVKRWQERFELEEGETYEEEPP